MLNLETNRIMETCEVSFDETMPCSSTVFECAGDEEMAETLFVEEEDEEGEENVDHVHGRLRGFLLSKGFMMGTVDKTLFLLKYGNDLLIVQIYVDDIIFGGSSHDLVAKFVDDMSREFEMSMMGELQFFLRLQIKQVKDGTFVHQGKYTKDMLKKFGMNDSKPLSTPMSTTAVMDADEEGEPMDQKEYRSMIGSLLYLTATRPDIQFSVCLCARFQSIRIL